MFKEVDVSQRIYLHSMLGSLWPQCSHIIFIGVPPEGWSQEPAESSVEIETVSPEHTDFRDIYDENDMSWLSPIHPNDESGISPEPPGDQSQQELPSREPQKAISDESIDLSEL